MVNVILTSDLSDIFSFVADRLCFWRGQGPISSKRIATRIQSLCTRVVLYSGPCLARVRAPFVLARLRRSLLSLVIYSSGFVGLRTEGKSMSKKITVPSPAIAIVGRHNSGKTTLIEKLIAEMVSRGLDVGSVKHHSHVGFEIDYPGKDSYRHRAAGAS